MKIYVLGEDKRSKFLKEMYEKENIITEDICEANYIITAMPFSKDGKYVNSTNFLISDLISILKDRNIKLITGAIKLNIIDELNIKKIDYYDVLKLEENAIKNAIPTAEGAIYTAINNSNITLNSSNILIMGFGKIGKVLANTLRGFGANIYVEARKESDLAFIKSYGFNEINLYDLDKHLSKFDFIFNTIPFVLLDEKRLRLLKKDVTLIDLASTPGGIDYKAARELDLNVDWALALPTKVAPKTSAIYLKQSIDEIIKIPIPNSV